jgi:hypothetical protein
MLMCTLSHRTVVHFLRTVVHEQRSLCLLSGQSVEQPEQQLLD